LPAEGRKGKTPTWPLPPDLALSAALEVAEQQQAVLEAQLDVGDAPRGTEAKLARLDQKIAELKAVMRGVAEMEAGLWAKLWKTPQAVMWDRLLWNRELALYVRWQVRAELGDIKADNAARQWSDRLGVNEQAMLRLRWKIADAKSARPGSVTPVPSGTSAKDRLRVVKGGIP
jgi:hypothetical protein